MVSVDLDNIRRVKHSGIVKDRNMNLMDSKGRNFSQSFRKWLQPELNPIKNLSHFYSSLFLSEQCKEIEENSRMGKTRDRFKKIRDTKGTFHAKMDSIKDRNGMDLRKEDIKKRWQEYTEELYKKDLHDQDIHDNWRLVEK